MLLQPSLHHIFVISPLFTPGTNSSFDSSRLFAEDIYRPFDFLRCVHLPICHGDSRGDLVSSVVQSYRLMSPQLAGIRDKFVSHV